MNAEVKKPKRDRKNEKGAAIVMALLISFLLLVASAGLLMESSMNTANVTDLTAEQQAYNAAESGIQSAVNVLRGNVVPSPLIDSSKPATDPANKINFVKALQLSTSNATGDTSGSPRLSRWMTYHSTYTDRVAIATDNTYTSNNGYAYSLSIKDPDNTGSIVSFTTSGRFYDYDTGNISQKTYSNGANKVIFQYIPVTVSDLDASGNTPASTNWGTFNVQIIGTGADIPAFNRFEIFIKMTKPYELDRTIRGYIETNPSNDQPPKIIFDAQTFTMAGSIMTLNFGWGSPANVKEEGPPQRWGYEATLQSGNNVVTGSMTSPEPTRLLLTSVGYGPRGATKTLEAVIQKDFFSGLAAPATLTLVGPVSTASPATSFNFHPGSSSVAVYSGDDAVSTDIIPPIGTINDTNLDTVQASVDGQPPHPFNGTVVGAPSNVSNEMPKWLSSPTELDKTIKALYNVADASGRYYASGVTPPDFGNNVTAQGITFCDGNCSLTGDGGGILVVTGKLTLQGNFSFNGLIIVTGQGGVDRQGAGNGTIQGNMVVAPYVNSSMLPASNPVSSTFLAPQYDLSGGGNSTIQYNSASLAGGLVAVSNFVLGVVEK